MPLPGVTPREVPRRKRVMTSLRSRRRGSGAHVTQPVAGSLDYSELPRTEWPGFFERMSDALPRREVDVEVIGADIGDPLALTRKRLVGISYAAEEDTLQVEVAQGMVQVGHAVRHPHEIHLQLEGAGLAALAVITQDGRTEFLRFQSPLALLPPGLPRAE
ncbi:MAG TPA: DUF5335 family protein [Kofleriaceae bacterium]|nr:DUF5335 family protein [Kofleriaceae bacterium]